MAEEWRPRLCKEALLPQPPGGLEQKYGNGLTVTVASKMRDVSSFLQPNIFSYDFSRSPRRLVSTSEIRKHLSTYHKARECNGHLQTAAWRAGKRSTIPCWPPKRTVNGGRTCCSRVITRLCAETQRTNAENSLYTMRLLSLRCIPSALLRASRLTPPASADRMEQAGWEPQIYTSVVKWLRRGRALSLAIAEDAGHEASRCGPCDADACLRVREVRGERILRARQL